MFRAASRPTRWPPSRLRTPASLVRGVIVVLCAAGFSAAAPARPARAQRSVQGGVGLQVFRFVDHTRVAHFRNGTRGPRTLITYVRYPTAGQKRLPLVVFAHGFSVTPAVYAALLDAWTRAGYVVAAPVFPVENADAPGGPDENDLPNEPGDVRFLLTQLLAASASARSALHGLIDPSRIAVAGQSDGGVAALAAAYDAAFPDRRIRVALILSGSEVGGIRFRFPAGGPPLLAVQGTADAINPVRLTYTFFRAARRPKFLLQLLGAGHLPPYSTNIRYLPVVERVSIAFLDRYLGSGSAASLIAAGDVPGRARLIADP